MPTDIHQLKSRVVAEVDTLREELVDLSLRIHAHPETAFQEQQASAWLAEYLERHGFRVERGICLGEIGRGAEGLVHLQAAVDVLLRTLPEEHDQVQRGLRALVDSLEAVGDVEEAALVRQKLND